ncbi:MAG: GldM family protein [Bacteroidota bacterium]
MKKLFCFLFIVFSLTLSAQKDSISNNKQLKSVVSADKLNVVYRGLINPISIAVNGAKSFTASAPGLVFKDGKYYLSPGAGKEVIVTVNIILNDNSEEVEKHSFRIKSWNSARAYINGSNCDNCIVEMTKEELETAEITLKIEDLAMDFNLKIKSFQVYFYKKPIIEVEGNKFNNKVLDEIKKLKKGTIFYLPKFRISTSFNGCIANIAPIKIMIVEREIPKLTKTFIKDSLRTIKKELRLKKKELLRK